MRIEAYRALVAPMAAAHFRQIARAAYATHPFRFRLYTMARERLADARAARLAAPGFAARMPA